MVLGPCAHALWKRVVTGGEVQTTVDEELNMQEGHVKAGGTSLRRLAFILLKEATERKLHRERKVSHSLQGNQVCIVQW